jgi:hypothetical protein
VEVLTRMRFSFVHRRVLLDKLAQILLVTEREEHFPARKIGARAGLRPSKAWPTSCRIQPLMKSAANQLQPSRPSPRERADCRQAIFTRRSPISKEVGLSC